MKADDGEKSRTIYGRCRLTCRCRPIAPQQISCQLTPALRINGLHGAFSRSGRICKIIRHRGAGFHRRALSPRRNYSTKILNLLLIYLYRRSNSDVKTTDGQRNSSEGFTRPSTRDSTLRPVYPPSHATAMTVPCVRRCSSPNVRRKTACGWPAAAQISSKRWRSASRKIRTEPSWPTGATPPMA
jgi:hypothetical protein